MRSFLAFLLLALHSVVAWPADYEDAVAAMVQGISGPIKQRSGSAIAVLDFTDLQGRRTEFGRLISEEMSTAIVLQSEGINIIDRANLDKLLSESKLQRSGLVDPENIKRLGKITGASALVIGTYTLIGESVRITAKVITTDTAQIVAASKGTVTLTSDIQSLLRTQIFDAGAADLGRQHAEASGDSTLAEGARLVQSGRGYTVTLVSAMYYPDKQILTVQAEYRNNDQVNHCVGISAVRPPSALTNDGEVLRFADAAGMKEVREIEDDTYVPEQRPADVWTSVRDFTVVPPGATNRIVVNYSAARIKSTTAVDVAINLLRGHNEPAPKGQVNVIHNYDPYAYVDLGVPKGCNMRRSRIPEMSIVFNGVSPRI